MDSHQHAQKQPAKCLASAERLTTTSAVVFVRHRSTFQLLVADASTFRKGIFIVYSEMVIRVLDDGFITNIKHWLLNITQRQGRER